MPKALSDRLIPDLCSQEQPRREAWPFSGLEVEVRQVDKDFEQEVTNAVNLFLQAF